MYDMTDERAVIRRIQSFLLEISYMGAGLPHVAIDGIYGEETRQAVRLFQEMHQLPVTGTVDHATWQALVAEAMAGEALRLDGDFPLPRASLPLRVRDEGVAVWLLQSMIQFLSTWDARLAGVTPTGHYDLSTQAAIRLLQRRYGLPQSGLVDRQTYAALENEYYYASLRAQA